MNASPEAVPPPNPTPPHTPLTDYYENPDVRADYVMDLFDRTAKHYNTVEALFLNGGLFYRRASMRIAGISRGMTVLDVATGTGAVACGAAKLVPHEKK